MSFVIQHIPTNSYYSGKMIYVSIERPSDARTAYYARLTTRLNFKSRKQIVEDAMRALYGTLDQPNAKNEFWRLSALLPTEQFQTEQDAKKTITNILRNKYASVDNDKNVLRISNKIEFQILEVKNGAVHVE